MSNQQSVMSNRQHVCCTAQPESRDVLLGELRRMAPNCHTLDNSNNVTLPILRGRFYHQTLTKDLSLHYGCVTELSDKMHQFELSPGISMNFIFEGEVDFSLLGRQYQLKNHGDECQCTVLMVNTPEIITRYTKKNRRVGKLNIYVSHEWLHKRCTALVDREQIGRIFEHHGAVHQFTASAQCQQYMHKIMSMDQTGLVNQLQLEQNLIGLFSNTLSQLLAQNTFTQSMSENAPTPESKDAYSPEGLRLTGALEKASTQQQTLVDIASNAHMSISSLQRQVKKRFGITVMEYIRRQRLEHAKRAMIMDQLSIGEAAHKAGYRHVSNFCTAFKRHYALTPQQMLLSHQGK